AGGIADRDAALLQSLPEVGKRLAETIVVTLKDKVDGFAAGVTGEGGSDRSLGSQSAWGEGEGGDGVEVRGGSVAREAIAALVALGEPRVAAAQWVDRVMSDNDPPGDVAGVLQGVYRVRSGG
ncbi:MAG: hypothetical protein AAGB29_14890, partial [Planctomycetota bacterium]